MGTKPTIPRFCPACQAELYPAGRRRPEAKFSIAGNSLIALALIVSATIFFAGMASSMADRQEWLESSDGPSVRPGGGYFGLIWIIPAVVPGIIIGVLAYRMPRYVRLNCPKCPWRERYRVGAGAAKATSSEIVPQHHYPSPQEEEASRRIEQMDFTAPAPAESSEDAHKEALAWAYAEIAGGRSPESVTEELVQSGWEFDAAERLAEQARKQTRHLRR